jgi:hypothetical protein
MSSDNKARDYNGPEQFLLSLQRLPGVEKKSITRYGLSSLQKRKLFKKETQGTYTRPPPTFSVL